MEFAQSLLLRNDLVHAREVGYDDCREFQIICPACHEPVFKAGSEITKRQYFSHYTKKADDCELRVRIIVAEKMKPKIVVPKGQELASFLAHFEALLLEGVLATLPVQSVTGDIKSELKYLVDGMKGRQTYRNYCHNSRRRMRAFLFGGNGVPEDQSIIAKIAEVPGFFSAYPPDFTRLVREVIYYLMSANAFNAMISAVSLGLITFAVRYHAGITSPRFSEREMDNIELTIDGTDREFRELITRLTLMSHDVLDFLCEDMARAIANSAVAFSQSIIESFRPEMGGD
jgi:hypothetical protein